ncbi:MAG TPA: hypothetical protein VGI86_01485 [Acidimicrobiia bacterium]
MSDLIDLLREMTDDGPAERGDAIVFARAAAAARPLRRRRRARRALAGATALALVIATTVAVAGRHSTNDDVRVALTAPAPTISLGESESVPPAGLQAAVTTYLRAHPKLHQRALFRINASHWLLIADGTRPLQDDALKTLTAGWNAGGYEFRLGSSGWQPNGSEFGAADGHCFAGLQSTIASVQVPSPANADDVYRYSWALARDPAWHIQVRIHGVWTTLQTVGGAFFVVSLPKSFASGSRAVRPVTASGTVPPCFARARPQFAH